MPENDESSAHISDGCIEIGSVDVDKYEVLDKLCRFVYGLPEFQTLTVRIDKMAKKGHILWISFFSIGQVLQDGTRNTRTGGRILSDSCYYGGGQGY